MPEKFEEIDRNDDLIKNMKLALITAECSRSGVTNPVNFIVTEGEGTIEQFLLYLFICNAIYINVYTRQEHAQGLRKRLILTCIKT